MQPNTASSGYSSVFPADDYDAEYQRLVRLDDTFNSSAFDLFYRLELPHTARVADVGPGSGVLARSLAGMGMDVLGVDRDPRVAAHTDHHQQVRWITHDLTDAEPTPELREAIDTGLDLVHARAVVMHLPQRRALLERMARWLRPGGWLVIGDNVRLDAWSPHPNYSLALRALANAAHDVIGTDLRHGWQLASILRGLDLHPIDETIVVPTVRGGGSWALFLATTMQHIADYLPGYGVGEQAIADAYQYLTDPDTIDVAYGLVYAAGQRPHRRTP